MNATGAPKRRPHVLILLTDDQGWGDLSLHGNENLETPHFDALAHEGARVEPFYVCPVCSPTRAEFLTGRYHPRGGVCDTSSGGERLNLGERTIGEVFRDAGYATGLFGKWHNGQQYPYHPNARGFETFYGFCGGHLGHYFDAHIEHNGEPVRSRGYLVEDLTTQAITQMTDTVRRGRSFFTVVAWNTPHSPMQVPERYWQKHYDRELKQRGTVPQREHLDHTRAALAMCECLDDQAGRLRAALDELDVGDDTIIVYFGDNGPNGHRYNGGFRGIKGSTDEGGTRSPCFFRWPRGIEQGVTVTQPGAVIDLLPTLADLAGIDPQPTQPLDGCSFAPLLRGEMEALPPRLLVSTWDGRVSVRDEQFRLDENGRLYDLQHDPEQTIDVAPGNGVVTKQLREAADRFRVEVLDGAAAEERPFPIGHPAFPWTWLPARDAVGHGGLQRSNAFPNDSYFTAWTHADDYVSWDTEVLADGTFEATIYYACPPGDEGATIELACGDGSLRGTIAAPHDPPVLGAPHDRVPRVESEVKDFRPLCLGHIELRAGRHETILRAPHIPGATALEFFQLLLRRVA